MNTGINVNDKEFKIHLRSSGDKSQLMELFSLLDFLPYTADRYGGIQSYWPLYGNGKLPASERQKIMQQVYSKYPLP